MDVTAEDLACRLCNMRGFAFYADPLEGGQDAYDISMEALREAEELLRNYEITRRKLP